MSVTYTVNSNQVYPRHTKIITYRCFLPDLTEFMSFRCVGPSSQCHLYRSVPTCYSLIEELNPAIADCRYRAPLTPRLARQRLYGGEKEIRTPGRVSPTHAFQACSFNRSDISPQSTHELIYIYLIKTKIIILSNLLKFNSFL